MASISITSAEAPLVLALDLGSSSVRAALFDAQGREVSDVTARTRIELDSAPDGAVTADPDDLLETLFHCIDRTLDAAGRAAGKIEAVSACTFVGNIMGLDAQGRPATALITYADTRAAAAADVLNRSMDARATHQRTGCRFHPSYAPAQLLRMRENDPEMFKNCQRWITLGEYLELKLFHEYAVSNSAAAWSGLLNVRECDWDRDMLHKLGLSADAFSRVSDVSEPRSPLVAEFAYRWPALASVPWFPAVGDGAAANVGTGCSSPENIALTMGTSSALRIALPELSRDIPDGLWCYRIDRSRYLLGGALSEGGNVFEWARTRLREIPEQALLDVIATPDSHGLTVLPFLAGERSPGWVGRARATVHGVSIATRQEDILAAFLEAVALRIGLIYERLERLAPGARIIAGGGALAASPVWGGIIADVLNAEVALTPITEASARGAALLALEALGVLKTTELEPEISKVYTPDPRRHELYQQAMARQQELYNKLVRPLADRENHYE